VADLCRAPPASVSIRMEQSSRGQLIDWIQGAHRA
jgi:hypothetical protein